MRVVAAVIALMVTEIAATALQGAATVDRRKIPPSDRRSRAMRNLRFSHCGGHAVDPHLSASRATISWLDRTFRDMWESHEFCGFQARCTGGRVRHPYSWLEVR